MLVGEDSKRFLQKQKDMFLYIFRKRQRGDDMALEARFFESVLQTKYLSAENYVNYRAIMRIFYQEHQKMHYQLDKQTIMGELRQDRLFSA